METSLNSAIMMSLVSLWTFKFFVLLFIAQSSIPNDLTPLYPDILLPYYSDTITSLYPDTLIPWYPYILISTPCYCPIPSDCPHPSPTLLFLQSQSRGTCSMGGTPLWRTYQTHPTSISPTIRYALYGGVGYGFIRLLDGLCVCICMYIVCVGYLNVCIQSDVCLVFPLESDVLKVKR